MAFYHGTGAGSALKILQSQKILPSKDGFFYCFDSARQESLAGALCFATGDGPRNGSLEQKNFFSKYAELNPDFPNGIMRIPAEFALKKMGALWIADQLRSATSSLDHHPAILVFRSHPASVPQSRMGFVNEVKVPGAAASSLVLERAYFDDALLELPAIKALQEKGIAISPISHCVNGVWQNQGYLPSSPEPDGKPSPAAQESESPNDGKHWQNRPHLQKDGNTDIQR